MNNQFDAGGDLSSGLTTVTNRSRRITITRAGTVTITWSCCDNRTPGQICTRCGKGPDDQPISQSRALASNA